MNGRLADTAAEPDLIIVPRGAAQVELEFAYAHVHVEATHIECAQIETSLARASFGKGQKRQDEHETLRREP